MVYIVAVKTGEQESIKSTLALSIAPCANLIVDDFSIHLASHSACVFPRAGGNACK